MIMSNYFTRSQNLVSTVSDWCTFEHWQVTCNHHECFDSVPWTCHLNIPKTIHSQHFTDHLLAGNLPHICFMADNIQFIPSANACLLKTDFPEDMLSQHISLNKFKCLLFFLFSVTSMSLAEWYKFCTWNSPDSTRRVYMLLVYGSKLSQLPRICAVDAVGIGAISKLLRTPYLQSVDRTSLLLAFVKHRCYSCHRNYSACTKYTSAKDGLPVAVNISTVQYTKIHKHSGSSDTCYTAFELKYWSQQI